MDIVLIILGILFIIIGFVGCVVPVLPGLPVSYLGILFLHFTSKSNFSTPFLISWAIIVIVAQVLDYYGPIWGTKKLGGGKKGTWGSTIGIIVGTFLFAPFGIIIFPFVGAVIGELFDEKSFIVAVKAGFGSFVGFLAGTIIKLVIAVILAFYFFKEFISGFFLCVVCAGFLVDMGI